jgi:rfaE bifunctional protein nucleotidyltransferase chain/domain
VSLSQLIRLSERARAEHRRLVLTNGCFDLLHAGHVRYLEAARALGDALAVALNDDDSVRRLKGPGRPVNSADDRAEVLGGLESVDFVCIFGEDTAMSVVQSVRPAVYVKGGDYSPQPSDPTFPPEGNEVLSYGGEVRIIDLLPGRSTSGLLQRLSAPPEGMR